MLHSNIGYLKCKYIFNVVKERYISESDISSSKHCHLILKNTLAYIHLNIYIYGLSCWCRKKRQNQTDKGIILTQLCVTFRSPGVTVFNKSMKRNQFKSSLQKFSEVTKGIVIRLFAITLNLFTLENDSNHKNEGIFH